ncbi:MAG: VCBS repeat-containing protein [Bacteroidetes bacterium]|nr:VCBS repeat-containing protein [Bacteroidota bacterium]
MKRKSFTLFVALILLVAFGCSKKKETLFQKLSPDDTGITFANTITETDSFNILTFEYIYNGGGVATADFNNDGLVDILFTGNQVPNKLYINRGGFKFDDVSDKAMVNIAGRWNSGVAIVDINNDGKMDFYVCATTKPNAADRKNMLFVNQGWGANGTPTFKEMAHDYKIDYDGHSVMAAFLDYDKDGDLDLYVLTNVKINNTPTNYRAKITDGSAANNDRLFRNNNDGTFTDVTIESGVTEEGFGLGLAIADFNLDGWPDIYVSNDYISNDVLYINNRNGTFRNATAEFTGHQSQFSMGNDAADFNNDGRPDIITLDMLPASNDRIKTTIANKSYQNYINNEKFGYQYQYVRNMLQLNNGLEDSVKFSEIGQLSGVYQTEWSWSPLFVDIDNDGWKDLLITNGFPKDITDKDFANYRADVGRIASAKYLVDSIPVIKIPNFAFKNNGDLTFADVSEKWGINIPSFSNGAAFADFDNDGDLDYVINNINDPASLYQNTLNDNAKEVKPAFLDVQLSGGSANRLAVGTKVTLYSNNKIQFSELFLTRGFLSSVQPFVHFGLGDTKSVDSIRIEWPDGKVSKLNHTDANQRLVIDYEKIAKSEPTRSAHQLDKLLKPAGKTLGLEYKHNEEDQNDFNTQRTLPHKFSQYGPSIAVGDINGDGLEDMVIGGGAKRSTMLFVQTAKGKFGKPVELQKGQKLEEDEGLLLFDVDNDQDLDLYTVGGSIEPGTSMNIFQDHLYINDGKGNFKATDLPNTNSSGSCVRAADFDRDGDLDLFVGGRVVPGGYPMPAESYLFQNEKGKLTDVTDQLAPGLKKTGMVTDALWTDYDNDGAIDLMVVGEFMPITFFKNNNGRLSRAIDSGLENKVGWWNSIGAGDFDRDGDIDYVVGNLGLNNNYHITDQTPLVVVAKDFDNNGSVDPVMACYLRTSMLSSETKLFPMHFWDELNSQSPLFRRKFRRYKQYSTKDIDLLFTPEELKGATRIEANEMATSFIENKGNGKFVLKRLETLAQVAPVFGIATGDFNGDGNLDFAMVGNDFGNEVFAGRYDAFTGLVMLGDGQLNFSLVPSAKSGFYVPGNAKSFVSLAGSAEPFYIASQNQDSLKVFSQRLKTPMKRFQPQPDDASATIEFNGKKQKIEFYYGSGFLSQSSRIVFLPEGIQNITVVDFKGKSRKVTL